jgi:hypothetical protein
MKTPRTRRSLRFPLLLAGGALLAACVPGNGPPQVAPRGTLQAEGGLLSRPDDAPFAVVFAGPQGQTSQEVEINVAFNRPMRALTTEQVAAQPPVKLSPAVAGHWEWVGTRALRFRPEAPLPRATEFTVEIAPGTRALDGSVLESGHRFSFQTERPHVVEYRPYNGSSQAKADQVISLRFNEPVDDAEVKRSVRIEAGKGKTIDYEVRRPAAEPRDTHDPRTRVELVPRSPLPLHTAFTIRVDAGLRSTEGPLASEKAAHSGFSTYAPLTAHFRCGQQPCTPGGWVSLNFNNPVSLQDVKNNISVEPAVKLRWDRDLKNQKSSSVTLDGDFLPGKTYRMRLKAPGGKQAIKDTFGQALAADVTDTLAMGDLPTAVNIGVTGDFIEPALVRAVPIFSMNSGPFDVAMEAVDVPALLGRHVHHDGQAVFDALGPGARRLRIQPHAGKNRVDRQEMRLDDVLAAHKGRGPVVLASRWKEDSSAMSDRLQIVQVTDLAISTKASLHESLVWVTSLSTGKPVEGAQVEIYGPENPKALATLRTDAQGIVRVPAGTFQQKGSSLAGAVVARSGDDWAYQELAAPIDGWRYGASSESPTERSVAGLLFTERGLYRPSDTVKLKGVARLAVSRGLSTPAGQKVALRVAGPDGETVSETEDVLSAFGTFSRAITLPPGSKLGSYSVVATLGGKQEVKKKPLRDEDGDGENDDSDRREAWSTSFTVAEYRPAEFKVDVELDRASYTRGDSLSCVGAGDYLFGAPMVGADAHPSLRRQSSYFMPPGLPGGYTVSDSTYASLHRDSSPRGEELEAADQKLDAQGKATSTVRLDLAGQTGPEAVTCEVEVVDFSRQSFTSSATAIVHPGEAYAALQASKNYFVEAGGTIRPEVLAVQPDGKKRTGVPISVEVFERSYTLVHQGTGEGRTHTESRLVDRSVGACQITSAATPQSCPIKLPGAGHFVVRAQLTDGRGNKVAASDSVYAIGGAGSGTTSWADNDQSRLQLATDKLSYNPGDTAKVLIKSPFAQAEALVTVEREGVLWQKRMEVSGPTPTVDIPVGEELLPNAFVSVLLVRGRSKAPPKDKGADVGAPTFRVGYAPIAVNTESRRLKVEVKPAKTEFRPGDEVAVDLDVKNAAGKGERTELAFYAVDEGVLSLVGYRTPDPVAAFFAPRGTQVQTFEAREHLGHILSKETGVAMGLEKGLEGGGGGGDTRRDFKQTAFFDPAVVTDEGGHARVTFKLPDSLSTFRLMAVATTAADHFGSSEARVTTSKPLMVRPALPRILRAGDRLEASAIVTSKGLNGTFEVQASAEGLSLTGETKRTVQLTSGQSAEVRFAVDAPRAGKAKIRFAVSGAGASDAVEVTRQVSTPTMMEASALFGDTTTAAGEKLGDLSRLRDDVGGLEVSLSSTALTGLLGGVDQLIEYPYGCTEQLTSRLVPLLPLRDLAATFGLKLPEDVDGAVLATVGKVIRNQRDDGGFGLWPESHQSSPWITAYAVWGLGEAKRRGVPVRAAVLESATRFLRDSLGKTKDDVYRLAESSFVLDVLAENGQPDAGAMGRLFEKRDSQPLFARAQLLHALAISKGDKSLIDVLARDVENGLRVDGNRAFVTDESEHYAYLLDSNARSTAMALRALVAANPAHPLASKLAIGLLAMRRGGTWRSTQETSWALLALDAYRRAQESAVPDFDARVFLGQAQLTEVGFHGHEKLAEQSSFPMNQLQAASGSVLAFDLKGPGHLFYEARLRFARKEMPRDPVDAGFFIEKSTRIVSNEALREGKFAPSHGLLTSVPAGSMVLVDLTIETPSPREYVVIDDPLPAGLEAVDSSLLGTSSYQALGPNETSAEDRRDHRPSWYGRAPLTRQELRDDRVLFFADTMPAGIFHYRYLARATSIGTFASPPARIEEMYTPETFGHSGAVTVAVVPR